MGEKLTEDHLLVLRKLAEVQPHHCLPSAGEMAHPLRRSANWAYGKLRTLRLMGLVEPAGVTFSNARTWRITDLGRKALPQGGL